MSGASARAIEAGMGYLLGGNWHRWFGILYGAYTERIESGRWALMLTVPYLGDAG
jgi:hypothetical protein